MNQFLKRCFYHSGQYNSEDNFAELDIKLKEKEVLVPKALLILCFSYVVLSM